jgi:MFS transporter, DHA1 family, multidrug resistance protein
MESPAPIAGQSGRIFIFGFLSAIAPLSIDIYLPALPMLRQALSADEAQTLFTLSAFFIGFGLGQLLLGPLSDRFGRKRPLVGGLAIYIVASIACALATSMSDVVLWRFVQAFGGSVVPTVVQAMVRDLYDRNQSARILSLNMLVTASAPVVAPLIGGQVLLWFDWRAIFWVLVGFGLVSLLAASALPETLGTSLEMKCILSLWFSAILSSCVASGTLATSRAPRFISVACLPSSPARRLSTLNISAFHRSTTGSCLA